MAPNEKKIYTTKLSVSSRVHTILKILYSTKLYPSSYISYVESELRERGNSIDSLAIAVATVTTVHISPAHLAIYCFRMS